VKNALALKIMDRAGTGGSFTEHRAMDFNPDHALMGRYGLGHLAIADSKTKFRRNMFTNVGWVADCTWG